MKKANEYKFFKFQLLVNLSKVVEGPTIDIFTPSWNCIGEIAVGIRIALNLMHLKVTSATKLFFAIK